MYQRMILKGASWAGPRHNPSTTVNFYYLTLGDIIKDSSHQFYFYDTRNDPSKVDPDIKQNSSYGSGNDKGVGNGHIQGNHNRV